MAGPTGHHGRSAVRRGPVVAGRTGFHRDDERLLRVQHLHRPGPSIYEFIIEAQLGLAPGSYRKTPNFVTSVDRRMPLADNCDTK